MNNITNKFISNRSMLCAIIILLIAFTNSDAQPAPDSSSISKSIPFKISGEFGTTGELYSKSAGTNGRPSSSGRMFFSPRLTFLNSVTIESNFILSSEGNSGRQKINQFGINPKWRWISLKIGSFDQKYSNLTLNGLRIKGVGIELSPGNFRFGVLSGTLRRAVTTIDGNRSYKREIVGGKIGYKSKSGNSFEFFAIKVDDDTSSISVFIPEPDTTFGLDSLTIDSTIAPESITPQENIVIASVLNLALFNRQFRLKSEISASINTKDLLASEFDENILPDDLTDIIDINFSSKADYAVSSRLKFVKNKVNISVGQKYYGPGFVSLGLASFRSDQKYYDFRGSYRSRSFSISFLGSTGHDNLINQKAHTTTRNLLNGRITKKLTDFWTSSLNISNTTLKNDAVDSLIWTDSKSISIRATQRFKLGSDLFRQLTTDYNYRTASDNNKARTAAGYESHTGNIRIDLKPSEKVSVQSGLNMTTSKRATQESRTRSVLSLGSTYRTSNKKSITSLKTQYLFSDEDSSSRFIFNSRYQITKSLRLNLILTSRTFRSDDPTRTEFDELSSRLTIRQLF